VAELYRLLAAGRAAAGIGAGPDAAPFGRDANRASLQCLIEYARQQGLIPQRMGVDELF
jgi:4,5-dihydroxyphthalate decarboxylase